MHSSWNPALRPNSDRSINDDQAGKLARVQDVNEAIKKDDKGIALDYDAPTNQHFSEQGSSLPLKSSTAMVNAAQLRGSPRNIVISLANHDSLSERDNYDPKHPSSEGEFDAQHGSSLVDQDNAYNGDATGATGVTPLRGEGQLSSTAHSRNDPTSKGLLYESESANAPLGDKWDQAFAAETGSGVDETPSKNLDRTSSFPEVPPLPQNAAMTPPLLPKSQAENIIEEDKRTELAQAPATTMVSDRETVSGLEASFAENTGGEDDDFFSNVVKVHPWPHSLSQESEQARYEEGLPLIQTASDQSETPLQSSMDDADCNNQKEDADEVFSYKSAGQLNEPAALKPHFPDRKTTEEVLDSIQYIPHHVTQTAREAQQDAPPPVDFTGGSVTVPTETASSAIFTEEQFEKSELNTKDDDLAELWKAALGDDDLLEEDDSSVDPSLFFKDDGEGFLVDDSNDHIQADQPQEANISSPSQPVYGSDAMRQRFNRPDTKIQQASNAYVPTSTSEQLRGVSSYNLSQSRPAGVSSETPRSSSAQNGLAGAVRQRIASSDKSQLSRPTMQGPTQSFADKSKGGYTSPYDLPMDVTRPRKRAPLPFARLSSQTQLHGGQPPNPRSTSMYTGAPPSQPQPAGSSISQLEPSTSPGAVPSLASKANASSGSFFEELPSSKPRPSSSMERVVTPGPQPTPAPPLHIKYGPPRQTSYEHHRDENPSADSQTYQLMPPERMSLYGDAPLQQPARQSVPVLYSRYSPAPPQTSSVASSANRYTSSPMIGSRPPSFPHQPRTSSPLAQNTTVAPQQPLNASGPLSAMRPSPKAFDTCNPAQSVPQGFPFPETHQGRSSAESYIGRVDNDARSQYQPQLSEFPPQPFPPNTTPSSSFPSTSLPTTYNAGPDRILPEQPSMPQKVQVQDLNGFARGPPSRSQTQSPGALRPNGTPAVPRAPYQRPASVNNYAPSLSSRERPPAPQATELPVQQQAPTVNYIKPIDGRETDRLERWKGCPIFSFGFGGAVVKTFPQHVPWYSAGQKAPMMKCSPGEVKIENSKTFKLDEQIATFPGPLKAKGKKKDVLDWLQKKISELEVSGSLLSSNSQMSPDPVKRHEERLLLWNIMKVLVEYDGIIEGNLAAEKAARAVLSPEFSQGAVAPLGQSESSASISGIRRRGASISTTDPLRLDAMEGLRLTLLQGGREQAVWRAVDNRLWAHAMLLSSTLDKAVWKQVAQEFIRQEVKTFGENTESLSALYQIFAGNWEESIDELVPPSARAGLQMVSKTASTGPIKNALDGLDRWRETLTLILSNRTADDGKALVALGQLLAGYGRTEAAHICFIFAKVPSVFGGPDDPQVSVALLGADHLRCPVDYGRDFDSILLTEVYEFARTILSYSPVSSVSPHLQSYKVYHAMILAEYGCKAEAQQYCDTISSILKSTTKPSPYYHGLLVGALETLQERLLQAPRDHSGSWISRPSIDKVSGSIWARFNSYVAGDEDDATSTGSGKVDPAAGPFARVTGDSPTLSQAPSSTDLYNTYSSTASLSHAAPTLNTRYAPAGLYTPRSSLEQPQRPSQEHLKQSANDTLRTAFASQQYSSRPASSTGTNHKPYVSLSQPLSSPPHSDSYLPIPPSQPEVIARSSTEDALSPLHQQDASNPTPPPEHKPPQFQPPSSLEYTHGHNYDQISSSYIPPASSYEPSSSSYEPPSSHEPPISSYEPPTSTYEPASDSGYQPPTYSPQSYGPNSPQTDTSPAEEKPKKSIMNIDDEDNFEARAAALRREEKAHKDREADEAFRKAAEADAQKDKQPKLNNKKSWFGPWFSSSKDKLDSSSPNAPIKVKLGEENSFHYDQQLKKWVNKKAANTEAAAAPVPPPPKGPPSRSVSAAAGLPPISTPIPPVPPLPPSMGAGTPPSRVISGPSSSPHSASNVPSRTASPAILTLSGNKPAPSSDPVAPGLSPGPPSAPPSRPATGQSGASNIDDLIGVPQARKGGTVRKGKKGRGYVDVMAK